MQLARKLSSWSYRIISFHGAVRLEHRQRQHRVPRTAGGEVDQPNRRLPRRSGKTWRAGARVDSLLAPVGSVRHNQYVDGILTAFQWFQRSRNADYAIILYGRRTSDIIMYVWMTQKVTWNKRLNLEVQFVDKICMEKENFFFQFVVKMSTSVIFFKVKFSEFHRFHNCSITR